MKRYPFDYEDPHPSERWKDAVALIVYIAAALIGFTFVVLVVASALGWFS
jgi:hypothetical protein